VWGEKICREGRNRVCEATGDDARGTPPLYERSPVIDTYDVSNQVAISIQRERSKLDELAGRQREGSTEDCIGCYDEHMVL